MQKFKTESSGAAKKEDLSKVRRGCYVVEKYELFLASIGMVKRLELLGESFKCYDFLVIRCQLSLVTPTG